MKFLAAGFLAFYVFSFLIKVFNPKHSRGIQQKRVVEIKNLVESFDGVFISANQCKKSECSHISELDNENGDIFIPFIVKYRFEQVSRESFAILKIENVSVLGSVKSSEKWIWKT